MLKPLFALVMVVHGGVACSGRKACTDIGCQDQASITVHRSDWTTPPLAVELVIDGRRVTCPAPLARSPGGGACDDPQVRVEHRELADCRETRTATAVSQSCVLNGRLVQIINVSGTPQRIVASVVVDTAVAAQRSFDLSYSIVRPNGDECEPACRQRAETWELP
jgi:hypothetical protein